MKKVLAILMVVTLSLSMFGCGGKSANTDSQNESVLKSESDVLSQAVKNNVGDETEKKTIQPETNTFSISQSTASESRSVAIIDSNNDLYMWGSNSYGQLGDGTTEDKNDPVKIMSDVSYVDAKISPWGDSSSTCCITNNGDLYVWGCKYAGDSQYDSIAEPEKIFDNVANIFTSDDSEITLILDNKGKLYSMDMKHNIEELMDNVIFASISSSNGIDYVSDTFAAITKDHELYMWGSNKFGQLGTGTREQGYETQDEPVKIMDNIRYVSQSGGVTAAITIDDELYTWGLNAYGQLGYDSDLFIKGVYDDRGNLKEFVECSEDDDTERGVIYPINPSPRKIMDNVQSCKLKLQNAAALTNDGELYIWGSDKNGILGMKQSYTKLIKEDVWGNDLISTTPIKVLDDIIDYDFSEFAGAVNSNNELFIWGFISWHRFPYIYNEHVITDENEYINVQTIYEPTKAMDNISKIIINGDWDYIAGMNAAIITTGNELYMWGANNSGQLGLGNTEDVEGPEKVMDNITFR